MSQNSPVNIKDLTPALDTLLSRAKHYGASQADAVATHGCSLSVSVRDGELEDVDNSEGRDVGLRVLIGQRQACVSSSDLSENSLDLLAERCVAMAKLAPIDPYCGLALPEDIVKNAPDLDLFDSSLSSPQFLKDRAHALEGAVMGVKNVQQAEGASANWAQSAIYFKTSDGFSDGWLTSRHGLSVSAIAQKDGFMERDSDYDGTRWFDDLKTPQHIGQVAGERAVGRLGSKQLASAALPVMFDRRIAGGLIAALIGAVSGPSITRGLSFLKDDLSKTILPKGLNIIDDPHMLRGHGSRPWDGEGVGVKKRYIVENGVLKTWLLNTASAKQLGLKTTGHASRGIGSPPGVSATNSYLEAGSQSPEELMALMGNGLLVTEMFGPSLNSNTGDYSVGVAGFKIENGARAFPVSEITIAGNLRDMYKTMIPANDLIFDGAIVAPTVLTQGLTIAGL